MNEYDAAKIKLDKYVAEVRLQLQVLDRESLEERARASKDMQRFQSLEQWCVNYLRHRSSAYDDIIRTLDGSGDLFATKMERHVLHVERRSCVARIKQRILNRLTAQ